MELTLSPEQRALRASLQAFLSRRQSTGSFNDAAEARRIWISLALDIGIARAALPLEVGGIGGGPVETMIIMEQLGEFMVLTPYVSSCVIVPTILGSAGGQMELLRELADGTVQAAFAWSEPETRENPTHVTTRAERVAGGWRLSGRKAIVSDAAQAGLIIASARTSGEARDRAGVSCSLSISRHPA